MFTRPRRWLAVIGALAIAGSVLVSTPQPAQAANPVDFDPGYIISDAQFYNASAMNEGQIQAFMRGMLPGCAQANGVPCLPNYAESTVTRAATSRCAVYEGAASEPASRIINKVAKACGINPQVILATLQKENGLVTKQSPTAGAYRTAMGYACPDTAACDAAYFGFFNQVYSAASQFIRYGVNPSSWRYRPGAVAVQYHPNAACGSTVVNIQNKATAALYNYTPYQPNAAAMANLGGTGDACSSYGNRNFWVYFSDWFGSPTGKINPFGAVDAVSGGVGQITIGGWAIDPDTSAPLDMHVYIDGVGTSIRADQVRADVGALYPSSGAAHGFGATFPVTGGVHSICIYAINAGPGTNVALHCGTVTTQTGAPIGYLDSVSVAEGQLTARGWAIDPDTSAPIDVHLYVDSVGVAVTADQARSDVGSSYPLHGPNHGYSRTIDTTPGDHRVCAYGIDRAGGQPSSNLGCIGVTVPGGPGSIKELGRVPIGSFDSVSVSQNTLTVNGWVVDPDTAAPTAAHVYIDGVGTALVADKPRADVAAVMPGYGANHGFSASLAAAPGSHQVCVYAINTVAGSNPSLGCKQVTVPGQPVVSEQGRAPYGYIDAVTATAGALGVRGWAIDPDTAAPIAVHVYVDGVGVPFTADLVRTDVAAAYPLYGANHGFDVSVVAAPGAHDVCVYAINSVAGFNPRISCSTVTVP